MKKQQAKLCCYASRATIDVALVELPLLHSLPGADAILFLDFSGRLVSNTNWNRQFNNGNDYDCRPFDLDGRPESFSLAEERAMRIIWQRVAEDYAAFNINVTTERPNVLHARVAQVLVTSSVDNLNQEMPFHRNGGVSFVGVFNDPDWSQVMPTFVYYDNLGLGSADLVAEAASHEAGHIFGLGHDGQGSEEYYNGHTMGLGVGLLSWGTHMAGV